MSNLVPIEVVLTGRIVNGHPMERYPVMVKQNGATVETPLKKEDGTAVTQTKFALAIPKTGSTDWKTTPWGQQLVQKAQADWPNGEHGAPSFAWKVNDGDSQTPNTKGNKPCDIEGWPGHWIVNLQDRMGCICNHHDKLDPMQAIAEMGEIKTGDYGRVLASVKGNGPVCQSPGIYVNPRRFCLDRAGVAIVSVHGSTAADAFGAGGGAAAPQQQATPVTPVTPATDLLQPGQASAPAGPATPATPAVEVKYLDTNGAAWTRQQLLDANFTEEMIAAMPKA